MPSPARVRRAYSDRNYRAARARLVADPQQCSYCWRPGTTLDHVPALALHDHRKGSGCCELVPCCPKCNSSKGQRISASRRRRRAALTREANASRQW